MNRLRSVLLEFYPQALIAFPNLRHKAALAVLGAASTPALGKTLTKRSWRYCTAADGATTPRSSSRSCVTCTRSTSASQSRLNSPSGMPCWRCSPS